MASNRGALKAVTGEVLRGGWSQDGVWTWLALDALPGSRPRQFINEYMVVYFYKLGFLDF